MRKLLSIFTLFAIMAGIVTVQAQSSSQTATVRGRILDTDLQALTGAMIFIEDQQIGAISDVNGFYTIQGVSAGAHTIEVAYVGYAHSKQNITTKSGETLVLDINLDSAVDIDEVVIESVMQDQHRAINTQKNALNLVDIVSSEQSGKYPDSNIGDALKRISGINVQYDQGEARFGQVRGTPADMSSVTINGNRIPSAEGETRSVQLDLIPSDMIQTIEVNKVITPDMDADAIGGSVNLITKSAPSKQSFTATVGTGYNIISDKPVYNAAATYGNIFFDGKLGVVLSASYQNNQMGSDNVEYVWTEDGTVEEAQIRQYYVQRQRQSYSASLNYDINENHHLNFKGIFNRRHDWENRYRFVLEDIDSDGNAGYVEVQTKGGSANNNYTRLELQQTMDYTLGGEHIFGALKANWNASYAKASELRPDERYVTYINEDGVEFDADYTTNEGYPFFTVSSADADKITIAGGNMELDELSESQQIITEEDFKAKVDFQLPLMKGLYGSQLKFGAKYVAKEKIKEVYAYELDDNYATDVADYLVNQNRNGFMVGDNYKVGDVISREWLGSVNFNNDDVEYIAKESAENFEANENVAAAYVRYDQKLGSDIDLMVGVRVENTALTYSGYEVTKKQDIDGLGDLTKIEGESKNYTNALPAVMVKWSANDNLKIRAAFTNTIARPDYADLAPNVYIDGSKIEVGNSDLEATLSYNGDLFVDYYFSGIGLVRGGLFAKKIDGFIVDAKTTYTEGTYNDLADKSEVAVTQAINGGNAILGGAEISLSRDFGFIAPSLRCLGFAGTYTYTYSKVTDFQIDGRENETLSMPGSPANTGNISLYFEKKGFTTRLSYNFASSFIDEYGDAAFEDVYYDKVSYLDLNISYTFGQKRNYTLYADATNLLNQPLRYYQGISAQTYQCEYYGVRSNIGLKLNF